MQDRADTQTTLTTHSVRVVNLDRLSIGGAKITSYRTRRADAAKAVHAEPPEPSWPSSGQGGQGGQAGRLDFAPGRRECLK